MNIAEVTPKNVMQETLFCIKDVKSSGFARKSEWFGKRYQEGLRIKILKNDDNKSIAFIEYTPAEFAWRPIEADNYMFIHCMFTYSNKDKKQGYGALLISEWRKRQNQRK